MEIVAIYQFLRDRKLSSESPEIAKVVRTWEQEAGQQEKSVAGAAMEKSDRLVKGMSESLGLKSKAHSLSPLKRTTIKVRSIFIPD